MTARCKDTGDLFEKKPATAAERQREYVKRQRALGRIQRSMWATPEEWEKIRKVLDKERKA